MESSGRLFNCHRCRVQVVVCSACDRGQSYCAGGCAEEARRATMRHAGCRYQSSRRGRLKHAERSRRYRLRQQNVTHQGSMLPAQSDLLAANSAVGWEPAAAGRPSGRRAAISAVRGVRACSGRASWAAAGFHPPSHMIEEEPELTISLETEAQILRYYPAERRRVGTIATQLGVCVFHAIVTGDFTKA